MKKVLKKLTKNYVLQVAVNFSYDKPFECSIIDLRPKARELGSNYFRERANVLRLDLGAEGWYDPLIKDFDMEEWHVFLGGYPEARIWGIKTAAEAAAAGQEFIDAVDKVLIEVAIKNAKLRKELADLYPRSPCLHT